MHHTIFCSLKMFYLFFVIRTGGNKPTWKNEQNRSATLGPRNLNRLDILRDVFTSRISSGFLLTAVWILFFNLLIYWMGWCRMYPFLVFNNKRKCLYLLVLNVSVNSNWVHPPGQPPEIFFERANPDQPGNFFCPIPCPGAKNYGRIPRGWGKIFPNSKKLLRIKLAKFLKKLRRLRDSKTVRKSLNTPALIFN